MSFQTRRDPGGQEIDEGSGFFVWRLPDPMHEVIPLASGVSRRLEQLHPNMDILSPGMSFRDYSDRAWDIPER